MVSTTKPSGRAIAVEVCKRGCAACVLEMFDSDEGVGSGKRDGMKGSVLGCLKVALDAVLRNEGEVGVASASNKRGGGGGGAK